MAKQNLLYNICFQIASINFFYIYLEGDPESLFISA